MKYVILAFHIQLWILGSFEERKSLFEIVLDSKSTAIAAIDGINKNTNLITLLNSQCVEPPLICPNKNITFWLYTRSAPNYPIELSANTKGNFDLSDIQLSHPWKVIIHGYTKSKDEIPNPQLRTAYFQKGEYNLISVDYNPLSREYCYLASVHNVPLIAKCTAEMIENFFKENKIPLESVHVIGFSLGAQIAGLLHKNFRDNHKLGRVTGLDPASPLFDGSVHDQISTKSADFVDIIHTDTILRGKLQSLGHVDFYVNGGFSQPGCMQIKEVISFSSCNHDRAPKYFAESINSNKGFWGIPCDSTKFFTAGCEAPKNEAVIMGEYTPFTARGTYYLQTMRESPYALGETFTEKKSGNLTTGGLISISTGK